jgi:phenylpyruvate tautomerase PptA (4-oxalocrotonate tautomerase family)
MPCITIKTTVPVSEADEKSLNTAFGQALNIFGKSAEWLMVNFEDNQTIWFAGNKKEKAAYVDINLVGDVSADQTLQFTQVIGELLQNILGIPQNCFYITFHTVPGYCWGWNGQTF